jgi:hypothetical protein
MRASGTTNTARGRAEKCRMPVLVTKRTGTKLRVAHLGDDRALFALKGGLRRDDGILIAQTAVARLRARRPRLVARHDAVDWG